MAATLTRPLLRDQALTRLRGLESRLRQMGIVSLFLFGSTARDEAGPDSDVDLFGDLDPERDFGFAYFGLSGEIGDLIGHKVDFMSRESLHPMLKERIIASGVRVF